MQVGEIIQRVRSTFGDTSAVQIADTLLFQWIDDAVSELAFSLDFNQAQAKTDIILDQNEYVLPPKTFRIYSVLYDGVPLAPMSIEEYTQYMGSGKCGATAAGYLVWDGKIYLAVKPDKNISQGMHLFYSVLPDRVTGHSEIPDLPPEYHTRIVVYCLAQAYLLDNDSAQYSLMMNQFKVEMAGAKDKKVDSDIGTYPVVLITEDYGW